MIASMPLSCISAFVFCLRRSRACSSCYCCGSFRRTTRALRSSGFVRRHRLASKTSRVKETYTRKGRTPTRGYMELSGKGGGITILPLFCASLVCVWFLTRFYFLSVSWLARRGQRVTVRRCQPAAFAVAITIGVMRACTDRQSNSPLIENVGS